jgi:quercetin dioxygenase-like cupin family protein
MTQTRQGAYVLNVDEGEGLWFLGSHVALKVTGAESSGAIAILEAHAPRGHGSPLHVHTREDETFYVIDGELRVEVEDDTYVVGPGMTAFGPRNLPHRFTVMSEEARFLLIASPAGFEDFVRAGSEPATETRIPDPATASAPPDPAALAALAAQFGIEILGPPVQL